MKTIFTLFIFFTAYASFGQQLVYTPVNPAFGGDPFNYTWLLNSANAQNSFEDPLADFGQLSDLDSFTNSLNNNLLQDSSNPLQPGTTSVGNFELEAFESALGLVINVLDVTTGEQTQIVIPNSGN